MKSNPPSHLCRESLLNFQIFFGASFPGFPNSSALFCSQGLLNFLIPFRTSFSRFSNSSARFFFLGATLKTHGFFFF